MAIHFITGKPGGGKGFEALRRIIEELRFGERVIITNFAIRIPPWVRSVGGYNKRKLKPEMGLKSYLWQEYGEDYDCEKRIHHLTDKQTREFYLYRTNESGSVYELEHTRDDKGNVVTFSTTTFGGRSVLYCIDEAWKDFGSRDWQNTGKGVLFYNAQHRKFGDTVLLCTQNTKQVETALRQVAQDFSVVTNMGKRKMGMFRQASMFICTTYAEPPTGISSEPLSRELHRLDKAGLGGCFDTAAGIGVGGGGSADIFERVKGYPWWVVPCIFLVVIFILWFGIKSAPKWATSLSGKKRTAKIESILKTDTNLTQHATTNRTSPTIQSSPTNTILRTNPPALGISGTLGFMPKRIWILTDGSYATLESGVTLATERFIVYQGQTCYWHRVSSEAGSAPAPSQSSHVQVEQYERHETKKLIWR